MSTWYWTGGANDNTFGTAANWNAARDGSGAAGPPIGGDSIVIENTNQTINGVATGLSLVDVTISNGGNIGSAGTPLTMQITGTLTIRTSAGTHYIGATAATAIVTTQIKQTGSGKVYLTGPGTFTTILIGSNCQVDISTTAAFTTLKASGGSTDIGNHATDITLLEVHGGSVRCRRPIVTAHITGNLISEGVDAAVTTANVYANGKHTNWTSSTVTTSDVRPGATASAKGSPYAATITNRTSYEGSKNYIDSGNVTAGAPTFIGDTSGATA